jgi:hypothetical protein
MQVFFKTDFTKALNFLDTIPKRVGRALDKWKVQSASEVLREGQREAPYRTGRLRDSIAVSFRRSPLRLALPYITPNTRNSAPDISNHAAFYVGALDARRDYILKLAEELIGKELSS